MPAGYSGTPLARKLSFKDGMEVNFIAMPYTVYDEIRASCLQLDVNRVIRKGLPLGWVDVKVCGVDAVWSGLKLVIRKELR